MVGLSLVVVSCSKEDRFENWLTKKDGNWEITSMTERVITFTGADSTSQEAQNTDLVGTFQFNEDSTFSYDFTSLIWEFNFASSGDRLTVDKTFTHEKEVIDFEYITRAFIYGEKISASKLNLIMRVEWYDIYGLNIAVHFYMELERAG